MRNPDESTEGHEEFEPEIASSDRENEGLLKIMGQMGLKVAHGLIETTRGDNN